MSKRLLNLFDQPRGIVSRSNDEFSSILCHELHGNILTYPSGFKVGSWIVPHSWELIEASLVIGDRVYSSLDNPLLVPFGTSSFTKIGNLLELKKYFVYDIQNPDKVLYTTNYYTPDNYKISIPYNWINLLDDSTAVKINVNAKHGDGNLNIVESVIPGKSPSEILLTSYNCHPGLGNDNFSGNLVLSNLFNKLKKCSPYYK